MEMEKRTQQPQVVTYAAPIRSKVSGINEDDPHYKCCCGAMHVRTGVIVLAFVELVFAALGVIGAVLRVGHYKSGTRGASFLNGAMTILVCSLMIHGLRKMRRYFLVPHMIFQVLAIIPCFVVVVLFLFGVIEDGAVDNNFQYGHYRSDVYMGPVILGICAAIFALQIWFFLVVLGAFRYLHDKEIIGIHGDQMVKYAGGNV